MKRFSFPYQRLMEWRDSRAERERAELQRLHGVRSALEEMRTNLGACIDEARMPPQPGDHADACSLQHAAAYARALRGREKAIENAQVECRADLARQTSVCTEADRDHRLLVRLHDRQLAVWRGDLFRELEQTASDNWMAGRSRNGAALKRTS